MSRTPLERNLIEVAANADRICEITGATYAGDMQEAVDGRSQRRRSSLLEEIAAALQDEMHLLIWDADTNRYEVIEEPDGYETPDGNVVVAGPFGNVPFTGARR